jgi:preprotein translocase subunit SecA
MFHPVFFNKYSRVYGLTGTVGNDEEKTELREAYSLDSFDVPTYRPVIRKELSPIFCKDTE